MLVSQNLPAAIGVTDQTGCVGDQNQALSVAENFSGEITLTLQFSFESFKAADVEHQAAILSDFAVAVANGERVDQHVDRTAVFLFQDLFAIMQRSLPLQFREKRAVRLTVPEHVLTRITLQKFCAAVVSEHAHQSVVDFYKTAIRTAEEKPFLNIVEEFAVTALRLAAVINCLR